jgi:hypothetical protein
MPPPWRRRELCGVHGPRRQVGASSFLSDNIHDDWDPAEDAHVGSRWCSGSGGLSYGDGDGDDDVDDKE